MIGGGGQSIGLHAAGLAVAHGAEIVDYVDDRDERLEVAAAFGARVHTVARRRPTSVLPAVSDRYDVAVEASSAEQGLRDAIRALRPGGICTGTGYYLAPGTKLPVMSMYATSATLRVSVSNVRPHLPELLDFIAERAASRRRRSPVCWPTGRTRRRRTRRTHQAGAAPRSARSRP